MHESFLFYQKFRYLKLGLLLVLLSIVGYLWHEPAEPPNGGTWLGYTLGGVGAFIIVLLLWFGVRKYQYHSKAGTVRGWLSAHVYLGISLLVLVTLHTGFQFGWNVHTLAYTLMVIVVLSGVFGVLTYVRDPSLMTENRAGLTQEAMVAEIEGLDRECLSLADNVDDEIHDMVLYAINDSTVGGSAWQQLRPPKDFKAHAKAVDALNDCLQGTLYGPKIKTIRGLIEFMHRKMEMVRRFQQDIQHKALMEIWLYVHVPLSFALVGALIAHVVSVFFYW